MNFVTKDLSARLLSLPSWMGLAEPDALLLGIFEFERNVLLFMILICLFGIWGPPSFWISDCFPFLAATSSDAFFWLNYGPSVTPFSLGNGEASPSYYLCVFYELKDPPELPPFLLFFYDNLCAYFVKLYDFYDAIFMNEIKISKF